MATTDPNLQSLNRLHIEFNRTLENLGRLLSAEARQDKSALVSHRGKLLRQLPASAKSFHGALDRLEDDLEVAQLVMRRDLAVLREKSNEQLMKAESTPVPSAATGNDGLAPESATMKETDSTSPQIKVQPLSREPSQQPAQEPGKSEAENNQAQDMEDVKPTTESNGHPVPTSAPESQPAPIITDLRQDNPADDEIDFSTPPNPTTTAPDTATTAPTNDLDSLFNASPRASEPNSTAQNSGPATASGEADHDFDFDAFNASLDVPGGGENGNGLEGLLPGLRDYANNQPGDGSADGDDEFAALFSAPAEREGDGQGEDLGNLMDFEAFVGDGAGNTGAENGSGGVDADLFDYDFTS